MSCCDADKPAAKAADSSAAINEIVLESPEAADGLRQTILSVPGMHCGGCVQKIERALRELPGVEQARVNLSSRLATIRWKAKMPPPFIETLKHIGFESHLYDIGAGEKDGALPELVRALAVAGFAAMNIMLLSVSVWSGAEPDTRDMFHWISAAMALPTLLYSGRVFFRSAWNSLRHGQTNMDVPISIGVTLAFGMSLYETATHGEHAYFDASVSLLFFLLIGRALDHMMRERARQAVKGLARLAARGATVREADGTHIYLPVKDIRPGMTILLAVGERVPVDARVVKGVSDLDCSLVSGENLPLLAKPGSALLAGTLNLTAPLAIEATAAAANSFLAEMMRMMEAAESGRSAYRRIADRAARLYAPLVHLTAFLTFVGWVAVTDDIHLAITIAIAVLIITCPCALGLAVPMVQVVAARRLFEKGIMAKGGAALERLAEIDTVVFDKTGTLTLGTPRLLDGESIDPKALTLAATMASHSLHPYSRALNAAGSRLSRTMVSLDEVSERPGLGLEAKSGGSTYRLGRTEWALADGDLSTPNSEDTNVLLSKDGALVAKFRFDDGLRTGVRETIASLKARGLAVEIVSGDRDEPVRRLAADLGVPYSARVLPGEKTAHIASLAASGRKVLMVGDGLNDAPALVTAHASMAPANAADVGRNAADFVFLRESLTAVPDAIAVSRNAGALVRQNLVLAIAYNAIAVPVAILGYVTPLIAAISMSLSSLVVVANALRLKSGKPLARPEAGAAISRHAPRSLTLEAAE